MTDPLIGTQVDEYELEDLLGQGGMARVYRGLDTGLQRYAAIKVIDPPYQQDEIYITRFEREARAIALLDHPHIVSVYRYGRANQLLYLAMKYIEGADLHLVLNGYEEDNEYMPYAAVTHIVQEIGAALDYAHSQGVIHRDVKPSNVMLDAQGKTFLTDFGLALLTDVGTRGEILGTPHYIAPEQAISSAGAVPQSDLYALGVILYRMVTGTIPFEHEDVLELLMLQMTAVPPSPRSLRPDISPELEAVLLKALAKEPEARFPNGNALAEAFSDAIPTTVTALATAAPTLTVIDRVALDMERLPSPPSTVTPSPAAIPRPTAAEPSIEQSTAQDQPPGSRSWWPILAGGGLLLLVIIVLFFRGGQTGEADQGENVVDSAVETASPLPEANQAAIGIIETPTALIVEVKAVPTATPIVVATQTVRPAPLPTTEPLSPLPNFQDIPVVYLPFVGREGTVTEPETVESQPTAQTPTAVPPLITYTLILEPIDKTLFITNLSGNPFPLAGFEIKNEEGNRRNFGEWGRPTLASGACFSLSKKEKDATAEINDIACEQLVEEKLEFDWKEEMTVWYNGTELKVCALDEEEQCLVRLVLFETRDN